MVSSFIDTEARRSALAEGAVLCAQSAELERTAHLTAELFQVSRAAISVTDGDRQRIVAAFGLDERARHGLEPVLAEACIAGSRGAVGELLEGGQASAKVGFVQCQPIRCGDDLLGCLAIADDAPRRLGVRGTALMEQLALTCLDQMYLVCVGRSLMKANRDRRDDLQSLTAQNKSLKQRLGRIARLGRIGGWTLDTESDQIMWTDELPGGLALQKTPLGSEKVVPLFERSAHEQIRRALRRSIEHGTPLELEQPVRMASGETCWLRIVGEYEPGEGASGRVLGIVQDVSERYRSDEKITYLAHYDAVTGLPNRSLSLDRLQAAVRWAEKSQERLAVFVLDLDGFREINDELGYDGGDAILARLAERLSAAVRACDSVARLGGDRFAIVMNGMDAVGDAMKLAERLLEAASAMVIPGASATLSASIGIALFPVDGSSGSQLLRAAETALVRAKRAGGGQYSLFTARMAHLAEHRRQLLSEVRTGLAADQFVVAYQPKIELRTYRLAGFEALIRWSHPERGLLPPAEFWDALSDPALGRDLSNNVLGKVARQLADWRREGVEFGSVAVNVAAGQLRDPGFLGQIRELLARWDLPPSCLSLELTEGVLLGRRSDRTVRAIDAIHNVGLPTELDDFGTGFASLIHLRQFPVDRLKIDRSFVTDLATNPQNETIVRAVVEMAHGLQMEVVAEGVETADVDARLRQIGCDYAQGFFYAKPMLAEEVPAFARSCQASPGRWTPLRLVNSSDAIA